MTTIFIRQLWVYPVKSLGGVSVAHATITAGGSLALDREWIVVDSDQNMLWQGDIPQMTLVGVALRDGALVLTRTGMPDIAVDMAHTGNPTALTMYKRPFTGIDAGDAIAGWLSAALGANVRLVRIGDAAHRWDGLNPVHVVSDASLAALNEALVAQNDAAVTIPRFRPNIVLGHRDPAPPWFEETVPALDFGTARVLLRQPCERCELPNISLVDASRGKQPLKLIGRLAKHRPSAIPASFGTYCAAEGTHLSVGLEATL